VAIRVFLVDHHELVREAMAALLRVNADLMVVGEASLAAEALTRIPLAMPDVAVIDIGLPEGSAPEVCRAARQSVPGLACVMLGSVVADTDLYASVMAGAAGFLSTEIRGHTFVESIKQVATGESLLDSQTITRVIDHISKPTADESTVNQLSRQERRILGLIAQGQTNRQIGAEMYLAEKTVKNYVTNLLAKLKMSSRTEAAIYATRLDSRRVGAISPAG
jgi:DNA-binding NarL/FixJ family response regulator